MGKIQGEGDYEAARRYNERTKEFMDEHPKDAVSRPAGPVDEAALQKARSKAKDGGQDERDARIFKRGSEHPSGGAKS